MLATLATAAVVLTAVAFGQHAEITVFENIVAYNIVVPLEHTAPLQAVPHAAPLQAKPLDGKKYQIVEQFVLPLKRYIEGLEFINSTHLLMSSGLTGNSHLDIISIETMKIESTVDIEDRHFGEGITIINNAIYMLTYQTRALFKFDMNLQLQSTFTIPQEIREGWGMTHDD